MIIEDGKGTGIQAEVDEENRLQVYAIIEPEDKHVNKHTGNVWSLPFTVTPAGADDYFFYLKNTSIVEYSITDLRLDGASADVVGVHIVTGIPTYVTGTDITPVSRNTGKITSPLATVKYDTDITNLVDGGELYFLTCEANKLSHLSSSANIIIAPGSAIALRAAIGTGSIKGMVSLVGAD